ncbi:hypothetical protein L2E82_44176 [Cichorium intybus]|uniref:Uncharacterized protein n=1 Tax=Cichorium intybus TaxID=13427 RepID=A0ACB8ZPS1_CICIN|nr:hypothetical protein L2E82_44176 [Cichorium intybus]
MLVSEFLDTDCDGRISREDLKTSYVDTADYVIDTMTMVTGSNMDAYVEYHMFEKVLKSNYSDLWSVMEDVFKAMDIDDEGKVGYKDLMSYLSSARFDFNVAFSL